MRVSIRGNNCSMTKVAIRLRALEMTAEEDFEHLKKSQPWVLRLAGRSDIANYLGISIFELAKLMK
jgi:hypothetical protein